MAGKYILKELDFEYFYACSKAIKHLHYLSELGSASGPEGRRVIAGMGRAELEDKHISLLDENHVRTSLYSC